jgi:hypothetical protein
MTKEQKQANVDYFEMMIFLLQENGNYFWPDAKETYIVKNRKFIGSKTAIRKMKEITLPSFHSKLIVK